MTRYPKQFRLSDRARRRIRAELSAYLDLYQAGPVRTPFSSLLARAAPACGVSLLAIGLTGAGISYASEQALPGDALYPVKVSIVEPAVAAFQDTPEEKEEWHRTITQRRLSEATELATTEKLDATTREQIDAAVKTEARRMNAIADRYGKEGDSARELAIRSELEARLAAHERVLDAVYERLPEDTTLREEVKELRDSIDAEQEYMTERRRAAEQLTERGGKPADAAIQAALSAIESSSVRVEETHRKRSALDEEAQERMERAHRYAEFVRTELREGRVSGNTYVLAEEGARAAREAAIYAFWSTQVREADEIHQAADEEVQDAGDDDR